MSFGKKVFSIITLVFAVTAYTTITAAQDSDDAKANGAERPKLEGREGRMGRKGGQRFQGEGRGEGRGRRGMRGHRGGMVKGLSRLELTESQKSQIKVLVDTNKNGAEPFRTEMRGFMTKMRDGSATEDDKTRMKELRVQQKASMDQLKQSILGILTPDQLQQLEQMKLEKKQRMEERRQRYLERRNQTEQPAKPADS